VLCLSFVLACGSNPSGPPCDVRTDRMDLTLTMLARDNTVFYAAPGMKVLELPDGARIEQRGPSILINADGEVVFQGQAIGTSREMLNERLSMMADSLRSWEPLYVVADPELTLGVLDEVLAAVPSIFETRLAGYGVQVPLDVYQQRLRESSSVKRFEKEMAKADPGSKATYLAKAIEEAIGGDCPQLSMVFGGVAMLGEDKGTYMAREMPRALAECKCSVKDADLIEFSMYTIFGAFERPQRWIPLQREHGASMATVQNLVR
jgi:hypothetical protein